MILWRGGGRYIDLFCFLAYNIRVLLVRVRRSMDRTLACEAEDPGSTPGGRTKKEIVQNLFFYFIFILKTTSQIS